MTPLDISASPPSQAGNSPESVLVRPPEEWLSAQAIRSSASAVMARAQANESRHFTWHPERMAVATAYVVALMKERYPDGLVPLYSIWRHVASGDQNRWNQLAAEHGLSPETTRLEHARAQIDFAVVAALMAGGQAPLWHARRAGAEALAQHAQRTAQARPHPARRPRAAAAPRPHGRLCHARSAGGDGSVRPHHRHERRPHRAAGRPA